MADDGLQPLSDIEAELEDLGPLMAQQEMALEAEPDPEFVRSLRNRLTGEAEPVVSVQERRTGRLAAWARKYSLVAGGLAAAAVVLLVVLLKYGSGSPGTTPVQSAFHLPRPDQADITRSYPSPGGVGAGGPPPIWSSNLVPPAGAAYAGRLTLHGKPLPSIPERAQAYRLQGSQFDASRLGALATSLGISGSVRHMTVEHQRWVYVAEQTGPALHSVAVNLDSGELVYHDTRSTAPVPTRVTDKEQAQARAWMSKLGWPADSMPYRAPGTEQERALPWVVRFNWPRAETDVPAASVALDRTGAVTDAVLEPPVLATEQVSLESRQAAWNRLRQRGGPIGMEGVVGLPPGPGTATLKSVRIVHILAHAVNGQGYLVPAYRFEGTATINDISGTKRWFAIVLAAR